MLNRRTKSLVTMLAGTGLALTVACEGLGDGTVHAAPTSRPNMVRLAINITQTSGTVWGTVSLRSRTGAHRLSHSCRSAHCSFSVARGSVVSFAQTATDSATWPFAHWILRQGAKNKTVSKSSTSMKIKTSTSVTATYVLAKSSNSYAPPTSPYP